MASQRGAHDHAADDRVRWERSAVNNMAARAKAPAATYGIAVLRYDDRPGHVVAEVISDIAAWISGLTR